MSENIQVYEIFTKLPSEDKPVVSWTRSNDPEEAVEDLAVIMANLMGCLEEDQNKDGVTIKVKLTEISSEQYEEEFGTAADLESETYPCGEGYCDCKRPDPSEGRTWWEWLRWLTGGGR